MKIFFDTNVLVSAFATQGLCADLLRYVLVEQELVVGEFVLGELRRVLQERIGIPQETAQLIEGMLRDHSVVPKPREHLHLGLADGDDEWVVASAVAGGADILVTGDGGLTALKEPPIRILKPRGLWEVFHGQTRRH